MKRPTPRQVHELIFDLAVGAWEAGSFFLTFLAVLSVMGCWAVLHDPYFATKLDEQMSIVERLWAGVFLGITATGWLLQLWGRRLYGKGFRLTLTI